MPPPRAAVLPDPVLLFRYSALTGNGHRIHYDADYVRGEEGYPGLIVHGPLQATWMAMMAAGQGGLDPLQLPRPPPGLRRQPPCGSRRGGRRTGCGCAPATPAVPSA